MFLDHKREVIPELSTKSYRAVAVPGTVKGLEYTLSKYGTMKRRQVMQPAIELASKGFTLTKGDVQILEQGADQFKPKLM